MNLDPLAMRLMLEMNTVQTLGAVQSYGANVSSAGSFQALLTQLLAEQQYPSAVQPADLLYGGIRQPYIPAAYKAAAEEPPAPVQTADRSAAQAGGKYSSLIGRAAEKYNLPANLIAAVIKQESNFNPQVVSHAGAAGLMQLMPGTAKYLGVADRFDPEQNIMGGAKYLRSMLDQFGSVETALAAYNAGPGNVKKHGGIPPFKETQNYVKKVMSYYSGMV